MSTCKITTDDTLRETVQHGSGSYPFAYYPEDIFEFDFHRIDWHWHPELEFLTVTRGTALCLIGTDKIELPEGCGLFVNSGILHRFEAKSTAQIPNIVFSPLLLSPEKSLLYEKYIYPVITSCTAYQIFDPQIAWQRQILQILTEIFALQESGWKNGQLMKERPVDNPGLNGSGTDRTCINRGCIDRTCTGRGCIDRACTGRDCMDQAAADKHDLNELGTVRLLLQMWEILFTHWDLTAASTEIRHLSRQQARLQTMMQYIHDHYMEELTLDEIASAASISKSSALHIFKSIIRIPPVAYLIQYRLTQAAGQLHTTEKSVCAIAEDTGFANAGYFCRKFRQHYHMSPNAYRRKRI